MIYQDIDLAEKFIHKYNLGFSIHYDDICEKIISKNKWTAARNLIFILEKMEIDKRIYYLDTAIKKQNKYLLFYVLNILPVEIKNEYLKLYYMEKGKYNNIVKLPIVLSEEEAEIIMQKQGDFLTIRENKYIVFEYILSRNHSFYQNIVLIE